MVATTWPELGGKEIRREDDTWRLTGSVDVENSGAVLAVEAEQVDDVKHPTATLYFDVVSEDSLNPGALGEHFDSIQWEGDDPHLVVKKPGRTYRYELSRLSYE